MGALSGAATGASIGTAFGPWGTAIGAIGGGLIGGLSSWTSGNAEREQDILAENRQQDRWENQLTEAEGLAALNARHIENRQDINTEQADRYNTQQQLLAGQTVGGAERQMTIMGLQAQLQQANARDQYRNMQISGAQGVGAAQQSAAVSGLRSSGSVTNQEQMAFDEMSRQMNTAERQMEQSRQIVESDLTHKRITATEAAQRLRYAGSEQVTRAEEQNTLLDDDIETINTKLTYLREKLNQEIEWSEDDVEWLKDWSGGKGLVAASSFL